MNHTAQDTRRTQPLDASPSASKVKHTNNTGDSAFSSIGEPRSSDPWNSTPPPKCYRISSIPCSWNEDDLFNALHASDQPLTRQGYQLSLYPACYTDTKTALLILDPCVEHLQYPKHVKISNGTICLTIDSDFYSLTPLNVPVGEIVAELVLTTTAKAITYAEMCCYSVIAVTSLAGHAFGSWMSCESNKMWLKDFLPYDIRNIRIMSYGYDGRLVGRGESDNRLLDYQRLFVQDIENARSATVVGVSV
jgi:hypothetical protein